MKTKHNYTMSSPETIIRKYGYEWILVEGSDRSSGHQLSQPCFMGFPNMALKAVRKIKSN